MTSDRQLAAWNRFGELIDECRSLIDVSGPSVEFDRAVGAEPLPSLLEQCRELTRSSEAAVEPVRIISHLACTGGTLISKCLASMPNTVVLSEVAPHSKLVDQGNRFFPSDLIQLARLSQFPLSDSLASEIFRGGLNVLQEDSRRRGARLVLRDHAHSKYSFGKDIAPTLSLLNDVRALFPVVCVVTVRHPLDSFLSLINNDWRHFEPFTVDEYCRRYMIFLDDYSGFPVFKYEDFTSDPVFTASAICEALRLPFNENFRESFGVHALSGDSGRRSLVIGTRSRRPVPEDVGQQLGESHHYRELCERLGYVAHD